MFKLSNFISKPLFVSLIFFLLSTVIVTILYFPTIEANRKEQYYHVYEKASHKVASIVYELHSRVNLNQALSTFIEHEPNLTQEMFGNFVTTITKNDSGIIASMSYEKDFIITMIAPYEANKKAIGFDLTSDLVRTRHLERCIEFNKAYIEGPMELAQGDTGIVSYIPVYAKNKITNEMELQGVSDVVILWRGFLELVGLHHEDSLIDIAIKGKNGEGERGAVFFGDSTIFSKKDVIKIPIVLPLGRWIFAAYPKAGWVTGIIPQSIVVSYIMVSFFSILIFFILKYSHSLIQKSERRYRYIAENSRDIIWTMDFKTYRYTYVSESCLSHTGFTPEEYCLMEIKDTLTPESIEKARKGIDDAVKELKSGASKSVEATFELQQYTKDKKLNWTEVSTVISMNEYGEFMEMIGITRVINQRKALELEILEQQKELKKANVTKDKFFSIVAHDLKNPISSLLRICEFLIDDYNEKKDLAIQEDIAMLHDASKQTYKLLENLLEWARSQMGSIAYNPTKVSLLRIVDDCIEYMKVQAAAKNISIKLTNSLDECLVDCDVNMIHAILRNLVSNALKFSFNGSVIAITVDEYSGDGKYVQVSVKDSGVGIDAKDLNKLFRIDEKIISSRGTNDEGGTGLGLILCKEFIDRHKCRIWVESEKGEGTTFFFTLPKSAFD